MQELSLPLFVEVRDGDSELDLLSSSSARKDVPETEALHYDDLLGRAMVSLSELQPNREV